MSGIRGGWKFLTDFDQNKQESRTSPFLSCLISTLIVTFFSPGSLRLEYVV